MATLAPHVFISGTFADMKEWREAAIAELVGLENLLPVDLAQYARIGGLTLDLIKSYVDQSDIYLGVFGLRYGSRVNNQPDAPSWTHYEFDRFLASLPRRLSHGGKVPMFLMHPELPSDAYDQTLLRAREAVRTMSEAEQEADLEAQRQFIKYVQGHLPAFMAVPLGDGHAQRHLMSRLTETFSSEMHFRKLIASFVARLRSGGPSDTAAIDQRPPVAPRLPATPEALLRRIASTSSAAATCLLVPRLGRVHPAGVAKALAQANPWSVEDADQVIDLAAERFDSSRSGRNAEAMAILADTLRVDMRSDAPLPELIADHIMEDEAARMVLMLGLECLNANSFLREVWQPIEAAMRQRHGQRSDRPQGSLLLVLADDTSMRPSLAALCRTSTEPAEPGKPIVMTEQDFEIRSAPDQSQPALQRGQQPA
ncbi:DUF4062 domain-containing protein [Devosia sp. SD17-2]|uniref:DUF4062 domain-containing protein n=1 Tax=Devosia sp. SD17-2 TaxID=2976459 RepID=UPI0023D86161|nr:DUF4062 domain-containing protein [Devosia sp. SD17-2]WEJ31693.1 DUF4062 domain-containing protein [Devosia sp. SD17-2]